MTPTDSLNPIIRRIKGGRGFLLSYPFGTVFVRDTEAADPLEVEQFFPDDQTALRHLKIPPRLCVPTTKGLTPRYRVTTSRGLLAGSSHRLHSYIAACVVVDRLEWQIRRNHGLLLPVEVLIEDTQDGSSAPPRVMSDLGPVKDVVHVVPPGDGRPDYIVGLPQGAAAVWTGEPREEWWHDSQLLLFRYGLTDLPRDANPGDFAVCSIVRPGAEGYVVVAEPYHSVLHAARVSCWLRRETGIGCLVHDGREPQGFDDTVLSGDVVRMTSNAIETYSATREAGDVVLKPLGQCSAVGGSTSKRIYN